jgi:hypothetical protein
MQMPCRIRFRDLNFDFNFTTTRRRMKVDETMATTQESDLMSPELQPTSHEPTPVGNLPWIAAGLLIVSGIVAGIAVDQTLKVEGFFLVPPEFRDSHVPPPPEMVPQIEAAKLETKYKNSAWTFGLAGVLFGITAGSVAGVWRKSPAQLVTGVGLGAVLGVVLGTLGGLSAMFAFQTIGFVDDDSVAYRAIAVHATGWGLVGLGAALAAAISLRAAVPVGAMIGGIIGASILSAVIYAPAAAVIFPLEDSTGQIAPTGGANRILWTTTTSALIGLAMAATLTPPKKKNEKQTSPKETEESPPSS